MAEPSTNEVREGIVGALNKTDWIKTSGISKITGYAVSTVIDTFGRGKDSPIKCKKIKGDICWQLSGKPYIESTFARKTGREDFSAKQTNAVNAMDDFLADAREERDFMKESGLILLRLVDEFKARGLL